MWQPDNFLWCMDLKYGVGTAGVMASLGAVETMLYYLNMDYFTMFFWMTTQISVHVAWVLILRKDDSNIKYRKGFYYTMKIAFTIASFMYVAVMFMIMEIMRYLKKMDRIDDLAHSEAYAMLPGMMRLQDEDMEHDEDDEEDEIGMYMHWL